MLICFWLFLPFVVMVAVANQKAIFGLRLGRPAAPQIRRSESDVPGANAGAVELTAGGGSASASGPALPPGWVELTGNNERYWYHQQTGETSWTRPVGGIENTD